MKMEEYKKMINDIILLRNRNVIFYKNIKGEPKANGTIDCEEKVVFNNIFDLVEFFNSLKEENISGYYLVDDNDSCLYIYLKNV